jgi:hypothetical protein
LLWLGGESDVVGPADEQYDRIVRVAVLIGVVVFVSIAGAIAWSHADRSAAAASSTVSARTRVAEESTTVAHLHGRTVTATLPQLKHTPPWNTLPGSEAASMRELRREGWHHVECTTGARGGYTCSGDKGSAGNLRGISVVVIESSPR